MAAIQGVHRTLGVIYLHDTVEWFDPSQFELRQGRAVGFAGDSVIVQTPCGSTHRVPSGYLRLWCYSGRKAEPESVTVKNEPGNEPIG